MDIAPSPVTPSLLKAQLSPHSLILLIFAGLMGGSALACLAASAHMIAQETSQHLLATAGQILFFHAPSLMCLAIIHDLRLLPQRLSLGIGYILFCGAALFALDLIMRALYSSALFPMAAPIGGMLMISAWLGLSICTMSRIILRSKIKS